MKLLTYDLRNKTSFVCNPILSIFTMVKANGNVNDDKDNYDDNDGSKGDTIVTI